MPVTIELRDATDYEWEQYGITNRSAAVHRIRGAKHNRGALFQITVWCNVNRPNPHPGETKWTKYGSIGGDGQYLDPNNRGTDSEISVTTSAQATVIAAHPIERDPIGEELEVGQLVLLRTPDGELIGPFTIAERPLHDPHLEPAPL